MLLPESLKKGDTIGIIAPSHWIEKQDMEDMNKAILLMEGSGFSIQFGRHVFCNTTGYGPTAKQKAQDIEDMFLNPKIKMIFCAKGGYNSNTTFEYIHPEIIQKNPKILCGFSDSTSLLNFIYSQTGLVTFHGPTFKSLVSWETEYGYQQIMHRLVEKGLSLKQPQDVFRVIREGVAQGRLIGGNLSLFSQMVTGAYGMDVSNKILFLEESGQEANAEQVSNYFYHMKQNGVFDQIAAIWLGSYEGVEKIPIEKILLDCIEQQYTFPIIVSDNFGHIDKKMVIPIGTLAKIDTNQSEMIQLQEGCIL